LPKNPATGTEHFYSFDHGDAHFSVLLQPYASQYLLTPGDMQYNWLTNDLATTAKPWKFIFMHVPIASSGAHRFDDYAQFGTPDDIDIRNALLPVAAQYGVQMIFTGHDHNYGRFNPMNGVYSVVTGGGGVQKAFSQPAQPRGGVVHPGHPAVLFAPLVRSGPNPAGAIGEMAGSIAFVVLTLLGHYAVYRARRYRLSRTIYRGVRFHQTRIPSGASAISATFKATSSDLRSAEAKPRATIALSRLPASVRLGMTASMALMMSAVAAAF
jgi:hypothetical protein